MVRPVQFATDAEILAHLCRPFPLSHSAVLLGTSLERMRSLRDKHKTEIVKQRVEAHHQKAFQIAHQLEIVEHFETLKQYIAKTYGDKHA